MKKEKKVVIFGDSITQGYDAALPENAYAVQLVDYLNAEGFNKAIGGETFVPRLAALPETFTPDLIVVAYGTNDWKHRTREELEQNSLDFFRNLRQLYPATQIVALAPIWRADLDTPAPGGPFEAIVNHYRTIAAQVENMIVIDCFDFLPRSTTMFSDEYLHPNDEGFRHYGAGLLKQFAALGL